MNTHCINEALFLQEPSSHCGNFLFKRTVWGGVTSDLCPPCSLMPARVASMATGQECSEWRTPVRASWRRVAHDYWVPVYVLSGCQYSCVVCKMPTITRHALPIPQSPRSQSVLWQSDTIAQEWAKNHPPDAHNCQNCLILHSLIKTF